MDPPSTSPASKKTLTPHTLELFRDAIKRIKNQKQRPGFERIAQTLKTHHSYTDRHQIKQNLDIAVRDGLLLPVWTKGLECYKDPDNLKSLRKFMIHSAADVRRAVKAAVREIGDPLGSKIPTITNYVRYSFTNRTEDLDSAILVAVEVLSKKADLIKVEERFRSCHIAPPDSTGRSSQDLSSGLLDAEEEDEEEDAGESSSSSALQSSQVQPPPGDGASSVTAKVGKGKAGLSKAATAVGHIQQIEVDHHGQIKKAPRRFFRYQCWCCRFFTTSEDDFLKHVSGRTHADRTARKIIYCNSCQFRTRDRKKLTAHLRKHKCHSDKAVNPAVLLTFGLFTSLTLTE